MCSRFPTPVNTVADYPPLRQLHSDFGHSGMWPVVSKVHSLFDSVKNLTSVKYPTPKAVIV